MAQASLTGSRPWQALRFPPIRPPWWLVLIGLALLGAGGWYLWNQYNQTQTRPTYQTAQVQRGDVRISVSATGPIANPTSIPVTFKNAGRLSELYVQVGDRVTAGQVLAQLDTTDLATTVAQARAQLQNAQATEETARTGPTTEDVAVAAATLAAAQTQYENALRNVSAVRETAETAIASAQADVNGAGVDLANAQRSAGATGEESVATLAVSQVTLDNARVAYDNALKTFQTAHGESEKSIAANGAAVKNASQSLAASLENVATVEAEAARSQEANRIAVENANVALVDAERQLADQRKVSEAGIAVSERQVQQQRAALATQRAQRQQTCSQSDSSSSANGSSSSGSSGSSGSSCIVARRQQDAAEASLRTSEAQLAQTRVQANQSLTSAAGQVTSAQSAVRTAEASFNSGVASSRQAISNARTGVVSAQNTLKSAQATLESGKAQAANAIASSKTSLDAALNTVLSAQRGLGRDQATQNGAGVTAGNGIETAQSALQRARTTAENTRAQQAASVQTAQNTAEQQAAALEQARATYQQATAPPPDSEVEGARAQTEAQRQALQLAENNLAAATLVAPVDGVVANISGAVGSWISGGAAGQSNTSGSSSTSVAAISSAGSVTTSGGFITLTDLSSVQVTPQISEADIGRVRIGQRVIFSVSAFPGRTFTGTVVAIQPVGQTVSNVVNYNVVASVDPTDVQLLPTMTATVQIVVDEQTNVILVPNAAIAYARSQPGAQGSGASASASPTTGGAGQAAGATARVFVLQDDQPQPRQIVVGTSDDLNTQVISGLEAGERVVTGQAAAARPTLGTGGTGILPGPGGGQQKPGGGGQQKPGGS